jgi:hypothetical protein
MFTGYRLPSREEPPTRWLGVYASVIVSIPLFAVVLIFITFILPYPYNWAAASRIQDVDVASEAGALLKARIQQDVASAVLAQANQSPALLLKLLQDS